MPFSFVEIEEKKTRVIWFLFFFLVFFYFFTAYLILFILENTYLSTSYGSSWKVPSIDSTLTVLAVAGIIAVLHWFGSISNLIERISLAVGAVPIDAKDEYHQYFKNIVDEVSVAIGGRHIEARVIPTISMNAFALEDFEGRAVIGITEGLLSRLSRAQIEAVVGHEAGHIASGDCLSVTVTCALSEIYETVLSKARLTFNRARGRTGVAVVLVYFIMFIMNFLSTAIRYFVSRQREYRADALSVRITRDPLSLAEALYIISRGWRGAGTQNEKMQSIFIINPVQSAIDEMNGVLPDMFSTHPPVSERIKILLNMAHVDEKSMEDRLIKEKRAAPVVAESAIKEDPKTEEPGKWSVFIDQKWRGPFGLEEIKSLKVFRPESWVRQEGSDSVRRAYEDKALLEFFRRQQGISEKHICPKCRTQLAQVMYEGAPVLKCSYCEGMFVEYDKISRIMIREDKKFSEDIIRRAEVIMREREKFVNDLKRVKFSNGWVLGCPECGEKVKMRRQFFVYSYPVEIDRCSHCGGIWFDKGELEVLQYIYENKDRFFNGVEF